MTDRVSASRRDVLIAGLGGAVVGAAAAGGIAASASGSRNVSEPGRGATLPQASPLPVDPYGARQAGIDRPATPQPHALFLVFREAEPPGPWLHELGETIAAVCSTGDGLLDGPGDLSVTVGLGPSMIAVVAPGEIGSEELPEFSGDAALDANHRSGDVCVQVCGSDPVGVGIAGSMICDAIPARLSFRQRAYRPPGDGSVTRTPIGFQDGIAVPRTDDELQENVFVRQGNLTGSSIWVIRQFEIDVERFRSLPLERREATVGRREQDGAPLSGGGPMADVQLGEKKANGDYLIDIEAHVRRAHPSFTGSSLMLRRSYSYDNGSEGQGLMFVSFQNDLQTFTATQRRLDEGDAMLEFTTPRATFVFLALPGFDTHRPLGEMLTSGH